jgi:hypothetical protein
MIQVTCAPGKKLKWEAAMAGGLMKAALLASTVGLAIGLGLAGGISGSAAQGIATDVAYVEAVSGSVVASSQGKRTAIDVLDTMGVRTQLDLQANSELRICHYRTHKLLTLRGPLRAVVSASGVTGENGTAINGPAETCAAPVVSTFQGGLVTRAPAATAIIVPLRPSIKVVNHGTQAIRQIVLWDGRHQTILMNFDGSAARPIFNKGESYFLAVERSDGSELILKLRASGVVKTGPLILVVP